MIQPTIIQMVTSTKATFVVVARDLQPTDAGSYTFAVSNAASYRPGILSNPAQLTVQSE